MATKFLDYTGLSYLWGKFKEWCNSIFVTKATDENITGTKTFVGSKKIAFKQSGANDKLGFTLYNNSSKEQGYLEYNPTNKISGVPLFTLGNYASASDELSYIGFRRYSSISGASGAYNLLAPLISDAKTPFNLTTTYTNFYLPLGISDGTNIVTAANSGVINISSLIPTTHPSSAINLLTGYSKPNAGSALAVTDSLNQALGKLEAKVDAVDQSNFVHTTGSEQITGSLIISRTVLAWFGMQNLSYVKGTNPQEKLYHTLAFVDSEGGNLSNRIGMVEAYVDTDGTTCTQLGAFKYIHGSSSWVGMGIVNKLDGTVYAYAPTPDTNANDTSIATTAWVRTFGDNMYLPLTGGTLTGNVKFKRSNITRGTAPSSDSILSLADCVDSANNRISLIESTYYTDMSSKVALFAYKTTVASGNNIGSLGIGCTSAGNVYTFCPTPATSDNSTQVATTAWVRSATGNTMLNAAAATAADYLSQHSIADADYEMTYTDFPYAGSYTVSTFKANTSSAPRGNVGDYRLYCFSDNSYHGNFLCASPRQQSLFFGNFWNGSFGGWNEVATTNTSQTITGTKTFTNRIYYKNTGVTRGTAPSTDTEIGFVVDDANDVHLSALTTIYYTDKSSFTCIWAYNTTAASGANIGSLGIGCDTSGNVYTKAPTPATSDNSTKIATTAFVKNQAYASDSAVMHNSGNEAVSGTKTFNNRIRGTIEAPIHVTASTTSSSAICNTVVAVYDDTPQWISELYYCREASTNGTTVLRTWSKDHSAATYMAVYYDEANKVGYLNFDNLYNDVKLANPNFRRGGTRSSTEWWNIGFRGNNSNSDMGSMHQFVDANGQVEIEIRCAFDNSTYSYKDYWIWTKKDGTSAAGLNADIFRPTMGTAIPLGGAGAARWGQIYSTNSTISTSDEREKCDIELIPDDILDAWESCEFYQYKMKDSVDKKGENARYHTGMIAQRLDTKFKNADKNLNKYGLFCYDEWEASEARKDDHGKITEPAVEAGNEYSIRYEEALCMEAAYQRRKNKILEKRISDLEEQLSSVLGILNNLKGA